MAALLLPAGACGEAPATRRPLGVGDVAPAYVAADLQGDTVSLASLRGQPVVLNVWATWCPPCREEMPALQALHEAYADSGLHVIGVSIDGPSADQLVRDFVAEFGVTFRILRDPGEQISRTFRLTGVPETFLIDGDGKLARRWIGKFDAMQPDARAAIARLLPARRAAD